MTKTYIYSRKIYRKKQMAQAIKMNKFFDEEFKRMLVRDKSNSERLLEDAKRVFGE